MDRFEEILQHLGDQISIALHPDKNRVCNLNVDNYVDVQLEYDPMFERILIASFVCDLPPGKFRENVLRDCLRANGVYPRMGTFGFSDRNYKLALFHYVYPSNFTGPKLAEILNLFIERAKIWKQSIERGEIPPHELPKTANSTLPPPQFGR